jgi:serine/threonine protein phosphatase PrpC
MNRDDDTVELPAARPAEARVPEGASSLVEVDLAGLTHPGRVRPNNEDHYFIARFDRSMRTLATNLPVGEVPSRSAETAYGMLVADGVGGAAAGEVASRTAVAELVGLALETPDWIMRLDESFRDTVLKRFEQRFRKIHEVLMERAKRDPTLRGMGTTLTLAVSLGADLLIAHVGDSRAYQSRKGRLERLTRDQTLAQSLADAGAIPQEEVAEHPTRHVLTSAIATRGAFLQVELSSSSLRDGDRLLLCTDGLTEMVPDATIASVLASASSSAEACRRLVDLALEAGGKDNVTVVIGRYRIPDAASA